MSGLILRTSRQIFSGFLRLLNSQQRTTSKPASSSPGMEWGPPSSLSERMVRLSSGSLRSSRAMWKAYSLSCLPLGGKVETKQIFIDPWGPGPKSTSEDRQPDHGHERTVLGAGEVRELLLLQSE